MSAAQKLLTWPVVFLSVFILPGEDHLANYEKHKGRRIGNLAHKGQ